MAAAPTPARTEALLEVRDLTIAYAGLPGAASSKAVDGIRFHIGAGESVGVLGESGSGKTTTARALLRLLPGEARVEAGSIRFRGEELLAASEARLRELRGAGIAIVFQEPGVALNPVMRVGDQVVEVLRAHARGRRDSWRLEAEGLLERVGLPEPRRLYSAYAHELSGGQRQRVALAQALAGRPALLVADEPTTALDAVTQAEILRLLGRLRRELGLALLVISHDVGVLAEVVDRVLVCYAGRIVEEGGSSAILGDPLHPYTRGLLAARPPAPAARRPETRLVPIPGDPPEPARLPPGCAFEPRCGERRPECVTRAPAETELPGGRHVRCYLHGG